MPSLSSRCATFERAGADLGVVGLYDRPFDRARDDLALAMKNGGMVDDAMAQQRPILHQAEHGIPLPILESWTAPLASRAKVSRRNGRRNGFVMSYGASALLASRETPHKCGNSLPIPASIGFSMRLLVALVWLAGGDIAFAYADGVPLPRPRPLSGIEPQTFREAAGPDFRFRRCHQRLDRVRRTARQDCRDRTDAAPDRAGRLRRRRHGPAQRGVAFAAANASRSSRRRCCVAACRNRSPAGCATRPRRARRSSAAPLRAVETYDDFECRARNRVIGAKLSEHGNGNAVDVRALVLADGRLVDLTDVIGRQAVPRRSARERLPSLHHRARARVRWFHEGHIHLDLAERRQGYRICQWDVREPPATEVAARVPLPLPRPPMADAPVNHDGNCNCSSMFRSQFRRSRTS